MALAQLGQRYVDTNLAVGDGFHAEGFDDGRFGADDVAGQAILRDAKREHPAEDGLDFVDRDLEPEQSEVVSRRQTGWPGADDAHRLTIRQRNVAVESGLQEREKFFTGIADAVRMPRRGLLQELNEVGFADAIGFGAELIANEALQRSNGDRLVEIAAPAVRLAGSAAHAAADRCQGIGAAGDEVCLLVVALGDGARVTPGVGSNGAGCLALYLSPPVSDAGDLYRLQAHIAPSP